MRKFAATNAPGTCLWCGRKLPVYRGDTRSVYTYGRDGKPHEVPPTPEGYELFRVQRDRDSAEARVYHFRKIGARYGVRACGQFCTRGCAESFGYAFADLGRRLEPKK